MSDNPYLLAKRRAWAAGETRLLDIRLLWASFLVGDFSASLRPVLLNIRKDFMQTPIPFVPVPVLCPRSRPFCAFRVVNVDGEFPAGFAREWVFDLVDKAALRSGVVLIHDAAGIFRCA